MAPEQRLNIILVLILCFYSEIVAKSLLEDSHIKEFIKSRKLRDDGFNEIELTSVQEVTSSHQQSLNSSSIHRRRRSVVSIESYDIEISAFGESYKMTFQHTKSVLHPSAKVTIITDDKETTWNGDYPDCFLIGKVYSHNGTVSASFCKELRGMMSTPDYEFHFEDLPHHIRKRNTLKIKQHTTLVARKRREYSIFTDLIRNNDKTPVHQTEYNHTRIHKRSVPSSDFTIELAVYCDADFLAYKLQVTDMNQRIEIMLNKYNAVQYEWSRADVLNYNVTLSIKRMTFFDRNPSWYNTSTSLSVPLNTICTGTQADSAYDHVHVHTGIPNPELGGLAYQSKVCDARYRCGVSADGISTYATTVHEIGHNMGMLHDADRNCLSPDVGIMGGAGVGWSTCSCNDMNTMLQTGNHGCLWIDNIADIEVTPASLLDKTLVPELPGQMYTADEICEQLYGSGFRYRQYPNVAETIAACIMYSCVDHNVGNAHGQMFKHSYSIIGLYCGDQKICFSGDCIDWSVAQLINPEVRAGGWSDWGTWTTCSRTCGRGMLYRRRICNNPTPKNSATCDGNEYEAECCSLTPCVGDISIDSYLINQRASETCQRLIDNNIINGTEYTASGTIYSSLNHGVCEVLCESTPEYTRPAYTRFGLIENGTPCPGTLDPADANQYSRRPGFYYACLEGYCQRFDCNNTLNDDGVFDGCGVCNGDNSTCIIREGNYTDDVALWERRDWTEIPVGAYNIEISFVWNDMKQYYTEIFTKEGAPIITSSISSSITGDRVFQTGNSPINFGGTLWHNDAFVAIMHAEGPLTEPVIVKVYSFGSNSNIGMKYIYSVPTDIESCSKTCGNGKWNTEMCACDCQSGFYGVLCNSTCSTLCNNGAAVNESTCYCICNEKQTGSKCDYEQSTTTVSSTTISSGFNSDEQSTTTVPSTTVSSTTVSSTTISSGFNSDEQSTTTVSSTTVSSTTVSSTTVSSTTISSGFNSGIYAPAFFGLLILLMFSLTMYYKFYRRRGETESCCCVETTDDDYWNATRVNTANFNPRWMERLSDNLSVANLSIPGTHDTMARTTRLQCAWCQSMSLPKQMKTGIRYLDIRCRRYCGKLYVYHGPCFQNCELSDCFREMIDFLQENPSECLLVRVKQESECPINCTSQSFYDLFVESLGTSNSFWLGEHVPSLGSVRGMIVILREFELDPYSQALGIPYGNSNRIDIEDNYDQWSYQARHQSTIRHLTEAALKLGTNHILYLTHSSAVICKGLVPPRETARRLNPMLYNYIRERQEHLGIIAMDYPGPGLIRNIIDKNI